MIELAAVSALVIVIVIQAVERYFFGERMTDELSKCMKAIIAKNTGDYVALTSAEKQPISEQKDPDEVYLSEASEEEFGKFIKQQTQ